ncbi:sigma factor-like helix-turn-helix DNA-binding protein [Cellulomonas cellasea]|uniref:HTH cro/C1-type domain-containing protein n=2 Tax=Cellulomonas cellasea TaxID=43670 RepID=A0A0A0B7R3_9CELL|nr:sigma factor-like helix-turn-helix DNA-binding protein [Cellulomonas cellasea]KGM02895.1 hypothetical protein Q760_10745 [Cellulomonas cellasea DSM 20118]GEA88795.1 hypothetical protein CCE01nite_27440 [Cellulomonas cellasea]
MWALTIDQIDSRRVGDRVEPFLARVHRRLDDLGAGMHVVRAFERTVGDEVQGLLSDAALVVDLALDVVRHGGWSVGIGAGEVDEPLPSSTRAATGSALLLARDSVEAAKRRSRPVPLAVRGVDEAAAADAEGVLVLLAATAGRRSVAGWAVVDAVRATPGLRQEEVAERLGITQQAVSQRLRTALWHEEQAARPAAARLLALAAAPPTTGRRVL